LHDHFVVGLDLGQAADPTAVCVLDHHRVVHDTWTRTQLPFGGGTIKQDADEHFDVRYLSRLPLGLSYPAMVERGIDIIARPPLCRNCQLVIDETGVGRPVGDIFEQASLKPTRITITAGAEPIMQSERCWTVPKSVLISTLDARLHTGELRIAAELTEAGALAEELKDFRRKVSAAGRYSYEARVGKHDDLVLACAIALWVACQPPRRIYVGAVKGLY
jgi:hypothetical protein